MDLASSLAGERAGDGDLDRGDLDLDLSLGGESLRAAGDLERDLDLSLGDLERDLERSLRGERERLREWRERLCLRSSSESLRERDLERERE